MRPTVDAFPTCSAARLRAVGIAFLSAGALSATPAPAVATAVEAPTHDTASRCDSTDPSLPVNAYLDALLSHDGSSVPFTPRVRRVENGLVTGRTGKQLRDDLTNGPQYRIITGLRNLRTEIYPAPDNPGATTVYARYLLDVDAFGFPITARVRERFDVRCGAIAYIKATILIP